MKILLHVNYYEKAGGLDELFKLAKEFDYDGVELRWKYSFADMEQKEYQEKILSLKEKYPEFEITFGGIIDFCRGESNVVKTASAEYLKFMEWAKTCLDTKVMNLLNGPLLNEKVEGCKFHAHGSAIAGAEDYARSARSLRIIGDRAAELDMLVALETHTGYLHDLPAPTRKLLDMTDRNAVGVNLDYCNIFVHRNRRSLSESFEILNGKIYYAHLKNVLVCGEVCQDTHLEQGDINNMDFLKLLKNNLKSGLLALEYPSSGDGIIAAKRDMEYMKFLKKRLGI